MSDNKPIKKELTDEVLSAVRKYASSTRGANFLGSGAIINSENGKVMVACPQSGRLFQITIKETV